MFKKQQFPPSVIKALANNKDIYKKGEKLYEEGHSEQVIFDQEEHQVDVHVRDEQDYLVTIEFLKNGIASTYSCTCDDFNLYSGACEHVAAAMLRLNDFELEDLKKLSYFQEARVSSDQLISSSNKGTHKAELPQSKQDRFYEYLLDLATPAYLKDIKQPDESLTFEWILNIQPAYQDEPRYHLYMRVGTDHLYVVKPREMPEIAHKLLTGLEHYFGKQLTYREDKYFIRPVDREILNFILEASTLTKQADNYYAYDYYQRAELFQVHPIMIKQLIGILNQASHSFLHIGEAPSSVTAIDQKQPLKIADTDQKMPLTISIRQREDHYLITSPQSKTDLDVAPVLLPAAQMIFLGDYIYPLNKNEYQMIPALLKMTEEELDTLEVNQRQLTHLLSQVFPQIDQKIKMDIDTDITDHLEFKPLTVELRIDYDNENLSILPLFQYGDEDYYLLGEEDLTADTNEYIVIRQTDQEEAIARFLKTKMSDYQVQGHEWIIDDLFEIVQFMIEQMPHLEMYDPVEIYLTRAAEHLFYGTEESFPRIQIEKSNQSSLLDISFDTVNISASDFSELIKAMRTDKKYYRLDSGKIIDLSQDEMQELNETLESINYDEEDFEEGKSELALYEGLSIYDKEAVDVGAEFRKIVKNLKEPAELNIQMPEYLNAKLRPYQVTGYQWLTALDYYGFGGVLADDMGLGKTIQTIAFLCGKMERTEGQYLIICPSSVLYNWAFEFKKFAPHIPVQVLAGSAEERQQRIATTLADPEKPVIITSYPLIQRDYEAYRDINFETIVLDEAQNVKNANTKTAKSIRQLQRRNVIALSGTPIENNLDELWSLFAIVQPGLFPSIREFRQMSREEIAKRANFFILRRLKKDVLADLPPKTETVEHIELADEQKKLYQIQLNLIRRDVSDMVQNNTFNEHRIEVLAGMTRLRQICNDPRLVQSDYDGDSAKLDRLLEYLEEGLASGQRIVVFSQFTQMLGLIRQELDQREWSYHYLDGQTPKKDRLTLSERFNQGEKDIFLISLRAGGTGLNLTGGDTVLLYDSWWNPAVEDQAADRVHRFGQKKKVQVVRFITNGTIEEGISQLQDQKRELIDSIIHTDSEKSLTSLTQEDILKVLGVE